MNENQYKVAEVYTGLRNLILKTNPLTLASSIALENSIYDVMMEMGRFEGVATLVCMAEVLTSSGAVINTVGSLGKDIMTDNLYGLGKTLISSIVSKGVAHVAGKAAGWVGETSSESVADIGVDSAYKWAVSK